MHFNKLFSVLAVGMAVNAAPAAEAEANAAPADYGSCMPPIETSQEWTTLTA
jgi:hypothetical protein